MHYVVGDTHGCLEKLTRVLKAQELIGERGEWTGGTDRLWFLGDYTDRGPDGVGVIELVMRLEQEAREAGGGVDALLGNHDVMLLAALNFPHVQIPSFRKAGQPTTFYEIWRKVGGQPSDLERMEDRHVAWLQTRPALAVADDALLMHADSLFYFQLGERPDEINQVIGTVLASDQVEAWDALAEVFSTRFAFIQGGLPQTEAVLDLTGTRRLVHGHTPIYGLIGYPPEAVEFALEYNEGLCVNTDHCLWNGGPGFAYRLPEGGKGLGLRD